MDQLNKLFGVIFRGLGIVVMVLTLTFVAITVKSCSQTLEVIETRK